MCITGNWKNKRYPNDYNEGCGVVTIQYLYTIPPWPFPTKGLLAHGTGKNVHESNNVHNAHNNFTSSQLDTN